MCKTLYSEKSMKKEKNFLCNIFHLTKRGREEHLPE